MYLIILILTILLSYWDKYEYIHNRRVTIIGALTVIVFSLIIGLRWDVGIDYMSYYRFTIGNYMYDFEINRLEIIPRLLALLTSETTLPFYVWFIAMAFCQIYFLQSTLKRIYYPILCWGLFLFITIFLHEQMNIIRQGVAVCIVLFSYTFIVQNKNPLKFFVTILVATLFHTSAIIALPLYLLKYIDFKLSVRMQYIVIIVFSIISPILVFKISSMFVSLAELIGYGSAMDVLIDNGLTTEKGSGYGIIFNYIQYAILIFYFPKLNAKFRMYGFNFFYMCSFICMCLYSAAFYSIYLMRLLAYFKYCYIITFAFLLYYLANKKPYSLSFFLMIFLVSGHIVMYLYAGAPWEFIWNVETGINWE